MSEVRLRSRKSRSKRVREIQGMLAMQGLESETDLETERGFESGRDSTGTESPRQAWRASEVQPLPYRMVLANWPDDWRERWGRRANELEESGLTWRDAEGRAFVEIWGLLRASTDVQRN